MKKLLSCEFNIDTACVELRYAGGEKLSIYTPGIEDSLGITPAAPYTLTHQLRADEDTRRKGTSPSV